MAYASVCSQKPTSAAASSFDCIESNCLGNLILLVTCLISLLLFSFSHFRRQKYRYNIFGYQSVAASDDEVLEISAAPEKYITTTSPLISIFELLGLLADISIFSALLLRGEAFENCPLGFASVLFSVYLLLLLAGRSYSPEPGLQSHSICLYAIQWLCTALIIPAVLVQQSEWFTRTAILIRIAIFTALCLAHCISPRLPIKTSYRDDNSLFSEPGRDETASLFSRLTFWWINGLLWKAFRKTIEASDLYPLNQNQASAFLAPAFHATTAATLPFVWRIYHFFKHDILKQGIWATVTSIAVFIPPMLMRAILQYLESQDGMTRSTAWLCVGGLLASGLVAGIAECQCNWIG